LASLVFIFLFLLPQGVFASCEFLVSDSFLKDEQKTNLGKVMYCHAVLRDLTARKTKVEAQASSDRSEAAQLAAAISLSSLEQEIVNWQACLNHFSGPSSVGGGAGHAAVCLPPPPSVGVMKPVVTHWVGATAPVLAAVGGAGSTTHAGGLPSVLAGVGGGGGVRVGAVAGSAGSKVDPKAALRAALLEGQRYEESRAGVGSGAASSAALSGGAGGGRVELDPLRGGVAASRWHRGSTALTQFIYDLRMRLQSTDAEYEAQQDRYRKLMSARPDSFQIEMDPKATSAERAELAAMQRQVDLALAAWNKSKADFEAAQKHPESLQQVRTKFNAQIIDALGQVLDQPGELAAYLRDHGGHPGNLEELIQNQSARTPAGLGGRALALTLLARVNPKKALQAYDDQNFGLAGAEDVIPAEHKAEYLRLLVEARDPVKSGRRRVMRTSAQSLLAGRAVGDSPGSDSERGSLLAAEAVLHGDLLLADVPRGVHVALSPESVRTGHHSLDVPRLRNLARAWRESAQGFSTAIVGDGRHWVTLVVNRDKREITVLDPMPATQYFTAEELAQLPGIYQSQGVFPGAAPVSVRLVSTGQQRDDYNCMIFALLNAHQVAKKSDVNAYQEVTAALVRGELRTYDDARAIGSSVGKFGSGGAAHRLEHPPAAGYDPSNYTPFMNAFRARTRELIREWSE